ncbi:MAG: HmuY family protein [Bacteroidia bacterium]
MRYGMVLLWLAVLTGSCRRPEKPWQLPPASGSRVLTLPLGPEYDTVIFVNLREGQTHKVERRSWDVAFLPRQGAWEIRLNMALHAFAAELAAETWKTLREPSPNLPWRCDLPDTPALALLLPQSTRYLLLDRDRSQSVYRTPQQRYYKLQIQWVGETLYLLAVGLQSTDTSRWTLPLAHQPIYVQLERPGQLAPVLPSWPVDLIAGRYIHPFYDQPEEFRWYSVVGVLLSDSARAAVVREKAYENFIPADTQGLNFSSKRDAIGYDWKAYDFNTGTYTIDRSRFFVVRTDFFTYYKLRFVDFYDSQGRKGTIRMEYEPL